MKKGLFITLEGPDGSGKSTQSRLLLDFLRGKKFPVVHTREPGGTSFAENLRKIILSPEFEISPLTELFLYEASRAQHTEEVIVPALKQKKIVVCERYTDATCAYQGWGRKLDLSVIGVLNRIATRGLRPDLTLVLDVPAKLGLRRAKKGKEHDRLELENLQFHNRVRRGYFALSRKEPRRIKIIPAGGTIEKIHGEICGEVLALVKKSGHV